MLTEIYVQQKLRDLRTDTNRSPRQVVSSTSANLGPRELVWGAGVVLRRAGQSLERCRSAPAARRLSWRDRLEAR